MTRTRTRTRTRKQGREHGDDNKSGEDNKEDEVKEEGALCRRKENSRVLPSRDRQTENPTLGIRSNGSFPVNES